MPVKGAKKVMRNVGRWTAEVTGERTDKVLYEIAQTGAGYSKLMVPVDTTTLIGSLWYGLEGDKGVVKYTAGFGKNDFNYAFHLHENTTWKPRKKKAAKHHYLSDAFESPEFKGDYQDIIFRGYKV